MADLYKLRTEWTGFTGSPASTTIYTTATPSPAVMKTFWTAIKAQFPSVVNWTIKASGDIIDDATGDLTGTWSGGSDLTEVGSAVSPAYAAPVGCVLRLTTSTIVNNHRVKGRLFLVPTVGAFFDTNGTPTTAALAAVQTAGTALVSGFTGTLAVWARPHPGRPAGDGLPAIAARPGSTALVTGAVAVDKAAVLRTRRD